MDYKPKRVYQPWTYFLLLLAGIITYVYGSINVWQEFTLLHQPYLLPLFYILQVNIIALFLTITSSKEADQWLDFAAYFAPYFYISWCLTGPYFGEPLADKLLPTFYIIMHVGTIFTLLILLYRRRSSKKNVYLK